MLYIVLSTLLISFFFFSMATLTWELTQCVRVQGYFEYNTNNGTLDITTTYTTTQYNNVFDSYLLSRYVDQLVERIKYRSETTTMNE